jgi:hypothetical protein
MPLLLYIAFWGVVFGAFATMPPPPRKEDEL